MKQTKLLIRAIEGSNKDDSLSDQFIKLRKTLEELPGLNFGITFRYKFPFFLAAVAFLVKMRIYLPIKMLNVSISRQRTTDRRVTYLLYVSMIKVQKFKIMTDE